jgi:hypothetical protein
VQRFGVGTRRFFPVVVFLIPPDANAFHGINVADTLISKQMVKSAVTAEPAAPVMIKKGPGEMGEFESSSVLMRIELCLQTAV